MNYLTKELSITSRTVRYYEEFGLLPNVKRTSGGMRLYDSEDIKLIAKIKDLQKNKNISLENIKEQLLGESQQKLNCKSIVLTDSTAIFSDKDRFELPIDIISLTWVTEVGTIVNVDPIMELTVSPKNPPKINAPTSKMFIDKYKKLKEAGYETVYSVHLARTISETVSTARKAAEKFDGDLDIQIIETNTVAGALGLVCSGIAKKIKQGATKEEIELFINKQLSLRFHAGFLAGTSFFNFHQHQTKSYLNKHQTQFLAALSNLNPVFELDPAGHYHVIDGPKTLEGARNVLIERINQELATRGGYIQSMIIQYRDLESEAKKMNNIFTELYPHCEIRVVPDNGLLNHYVGGPKVLTISLI